VVFSNCHLYLKNAMETADLEVLKPKVAVMFMISENEVCSVVSTDEKHVGKNSVEI
jgi:hypothetical protein